MEPLAATQIIRAIRDVPLPVNCGWRQRPAYL